MTILYEIYYRSRWRAFVHRFVPLVLPVRRVVVNQVLVFTPCADGAVAGLEVAELPELNLRVVRDTESQTIVLEPLEAGDPFPIGYQIQIHRTTTSA